MTGVLELKDSESLTASLKAAANKVLTPSEKLEQRVSFVFASMSDASGVTKEQVREALASVAR
jgi:SpoU rRNA methylase family enzyme